MARIDLPAGDGPEVTRALSLRPAFAEYVNLLERTVGASGLDRRLHELVRMRVAQINECVVCLTWRNRDWLDDDGLLTSVDRWRDAPGLTDAERVALEYTERFCTDSAAIDDGLLARLAEHFDPGEIVELTLVVGKYLSMGRFMQVLGLDQACNIAFDETGTLQITS